MDFQGRSRQNETLVSEILIRQFSWRCAVSLAGAALTGILFRAPSSLLVGILVGGLWMGISSGALAWVAVVAVRHGTAHRTSLVVSFAGAISLSLLLGCWALFSEAISKIGIAIGLTVVLIVFVMQLQRIKPRLESHAQ